MIDPFLSKKTNPFSYNNGLKLKLFIPNPPIWYDLFFFFILTPKTLRQFIVFRTSSDFRRFVEVDLPNDWDASNAHLIDKLLSPSISMVLLNGFIVWFIKILLVTKKRFNLF